MNTARVEAFSDGIFAIAGTLLVLDLHVPDSTGGLGSALRHQWPAFAAFAVSFATIGIIWVNHNTLFDHLRDLDRPLVFLNLGLLLVVSFIPFPTSLLASRVGAGGADAKVAAAVYGATMTVLGLVFSAIWLRVSLREQLLSEAASPRHARALLRRSAKGPVCYLAASALSAINASIALVGYAAVAVYFALPGRPLAEVADPAGSTA